MEKNFSFLSYLILSLLFLTFCSCDLFQATNPAPFYCQSSFQYGGSTKWTGGCSSIRNVTASITFSGSSTSSILVLTFAIPYQSSNDFNATGIQLELGYTTSSATAATLSLAQLSFNNATVGTMQPTMPLNGSSIILGGPSQMWGVSSINFNSFQVALQVTASAMATVSFTFAELKLFGSVDIIVIGVSPTFQTSVDSLNTQVTVIGDNFIDLTSNPNNIYCQFGGLQSLIPATLIDSHRLQCKTPPQNAPGYYSVSVNLGEGYTTPTAVVYLYKNTNLCKFFKKLNRPLTKIFKIK